jgi:aminocarboxymuconate-semialdehyde decarboxylase
VQLTADIHQHVIPVEFVERVRSEGFRHGWSVRPGSDGLEEIVSVDAATMKLGKTRTDQDLRRNEMIAAGIDVAFQSFTPALMSYSADETQANWLTRSVNDSLASDMYADPEHISAMAILPLQFPALAIGELERVTDRHNMRCAMIGTHVDGQNLDDPSLSPFWASAEQLGTLLFVHPYQPTFIPRLPNYYLTNLIGNPLETSIAMACLIFGGVLERYPRLKLVFAHAGGYSPWIRGRWRHGMRVRPEARDSGALREFDEYFELLYFDSLIHSPGAFRYLLESVGAERILLGTDYPADMGDVSQLSMIRSLTEAAEAAQEAMLGGTAIRLAGFQLPA